MPHFKTADIQEYVDAILDLMEDGIFVSDETGLTLRVNKAYEQITGVSRDLLEGKTVNQLVREGQFNKVLNPIVVKEKKPASVVQEFGKEKKTFHLRGFPIFDDKGQVRLVITFVRDVTIIRQMREQIAEQGKLIEQYQGHMSQFLGGKKREDPIFASPVMQDLLVTIARVAKTDATVLLLGETGVGKDVLARLVHAKSPRQDKIFMKVDCGSIAENLMESELFGYVRGAFSGASSQGKAGYFEMANGGTVFLDEIGELSLPMQTKLLRILQDHEFMRVGSSKVQKVDVRIIAATNRDLSADITEGKFRQDLYYRLNVAKVEVPPLRKRKEDISLLAQHFLGMYNDKYKKHAHMSPALLQALTVYAWPGNVRELQNLMLQLVITNDHELLEVGDLPPKLREAVAEHPPSTAIADIAAVPMQPTPILTFSESGAPSMLLKEATAEFEFQLLSEALKYNPATKVAKMFGINRSTLFRKLRRAIPDAPKDEK